MLLTLETLAHNVENLEYYAALELLRDFWFAARERRSDFNHILLITGLPGSGKTALTNELVRLITDKKYIQMHYYRTTDLVKAAERDRLVVLDNFNPQTAYNDRPKPLSKSEQSMINTVLTICKPNSEVLLPKNKKLDTSNTYAIINTRERPAWLEAFKPIWLHLNPWRQHV